MFHSRLKLTDQKCKGILTLMIIMFPMHLLYMAHDFHVNIVMRISSTWISSPPKRINREFNILIEMRKKKKRSYAR